MRHCVTGYIVETVAEMAEAAPQAHQIDPDGSRRHVEENFNAFRLVSEYLVLISEFSQRN
jgi:hypothetical protein